MHIWDQNGVDMLKILNVNNFLGLKVMWISLFIRGYSPQVILVFDFYYFDAQGLYSTQLLLCQKGTFYVWLIFYVLGTVCILFFIVKHSQQ